MVNAEPEHDDLKRPQEKSLRGPHACSPRYLPSLFPYLIFTRPRGTFSFLPDLLSVDLLTAEKATAVYERHGALRAYARGSGRWSAARGCYGPAQEWLANAENGGPTVNRAS